MKTIIYVWKKWPLHLFLLPFFFISHACLQFAGLLEPSVVLTASLKIVLALFVCFLLLIRLFSNREKAAVLTTVAGVFYLFFGDIKKGLGSIPALEYISPYKILIPLLLLLLVLLIYKIRKSRSLTNLTQFLNMLFLLYLFIEGWNWLHYYTGKNHPAGTVKNWNFSAHSQVPHPRIFYIVLDCYPSPGYQQEVLQFRKKSLDSCLVARGFYVVRDAKSNFNNTAFSIASTLQMNYLSWSKSGEALRPIHYNLALKTVKKAPVLKILEQYGYELYNLSIFDLPGKPSIKRERFLSTSSSQAIFFNTLWNCLQRDIIWPRFVARKNNTAEQIITDRQKLLGPIKTYNQLIIDSLSGLPDDFTDSVPTFVYAHIEMPHFPYFYDSTGQSYPNEDIYGPGMITNKQRFSNYIAYTDKKIATLLDTLFRQRGDRDIFIIQSDHGIADLDWSRKPDAFRNYSAFYFPDRNYDLLYPGMSNVNTFRIVFNKYFGQQLPLLKDSSSFVK